MIVFLSKCLCGCMIFQLTGSVFVVEIKFVQVLYVYSFIPFRCVLLTNMLNMWQYFNQWKSNVKICHNKSKKLIKALKKHMRIKIARRGELKVDKK